MFLKKIFKKPLHNKIKKIWPVDILILNRSDKVKGRIMILNNSIFFRILIKKNGELSGVRWALNLLNLKTIFDKKIVNQNVNLNPKLKTICVVLP